MNTIHLPIPGLRERQEDLLPLANRFLKQYSAQYGRTVEKLSAETQHRLTEYPGYGNIRELQQTIEKDVILSEGKELQSETLQFSNAHPIGETTQPEQKHIPFQTLDEKECSLVRSAIDQSNGNMSQAAAQLGITRQTLYNKMKRYGL